MSRHKFYFMEWPTESAGAIEFPDPVLTRCGQYLVKKLFIFAQSEARHSSALCVIVQWNLCFFQSRLYRRLCPELDSAGFLLLVELHLKLIPLFGSSPKRHAVLLICCYTNMFWHPKWVVFTYVIQVIECAKSFSNHFWAYKHVDSAH